VAQQKLSTWLEANHLAHSSAGLAMAARVADSTFVSTAGHSSLTFGCPVDKATLFNIGSLTKHMVAIAALELEASGQLSLTDPVGEYLDDVAGAHWNHISLRSLLGHTSGIPDCQAYFSWDQATSCEKIIAAIAGRNVNFPTNQAWAYSNSNYLLMGVIIERVTGLKLRDFLEERLFRRLGLPYARCDSTWSLVPNRAEPYEIVRGNFIHAPRLHPTVTSLGGFGALFSIEDFLIWSDALYSGSHANSHRDCLAPVRLADGTQLPYGFGWYLGVMRGCSFAWHMGAPPGFRTIHLHVPSKKIAVSLCANSGIEKAALKKAALEILEQLSPNSTFLSIDRTEQAPAEDRQAIQALLQNKGLAPPSGVLTEAMEYTWICSPGSKPMNSFVVDRCWLLEQHPFGEGTIKNYVARAAGGLHYFSVLWSKDRQIAALAM
jgi:D-alanyl-D-alanine carboxypeptidase